MYVQHDEFGGTAAVHSQDKAALAQASGSSSDDDSSSEAEGSDHVKPAPRRSSVAAHTTPEVKLSQQAHAAYGGANGASRSMEVNSNGVGVSVSSNGASGSSARFDGDAQLDPLCRDTQGNSGPALANADSDDDNGTAVASDQRGMYISTPAPRFAVPKRIEDYSNYGGSSGGGTGTKFVAGSRWETEETPNFFESVMQKGSKLLSELSGSENDDDDDEREAQRPGAHTQRDAHEDSPSGSGSGSDDEAALARMPELAWARVRLLEDPQSSVMVREALDALGVVTPRQEAQMVASVAKGDTVVARLFGWYGQRDVFRFVAYVRAHADLR